MHTKDLNLVLQEMSVLSNKVHHNDHEKRRFAFLQTAAAAIRAGASLEELDQDFLNDQERRSGLPITPKGMLTREQRAEAQGWQTFLSNKKETRDMVEGNPISRIGTYTSFGTFVPTGYLPKLFSALSAHDVLFDEDSVTLIRGTNGQPLPVPTMGDIEVFACIVGEAGSQSSVDFNAPGQATAVVYTYNSKRVVISMEAMQDASEALSMVDITRNVFASRLARGIGKDLLTGNGTNKPLGLLTALSNLGLAPVSANGSAGNTGGSETGATTIGSADLANLYDSLDSAYLSSPKTAFLMNLKTLGFLNGLVDKMGAPLNIVKYNQDGFPRIFGVPVKVSPSMPSLGASQTPVLLGDLSYWVTRIVADDNVGLRTYVEAPGIAAEGNVGLGCFVRAGGALAYTDTASPAPFVVLQNHS
jgi:HK97 family phage major capsid protein